MRVTQLMPLHKKIIVGKQSRHDLRACNMTASKQKNGDRSLSSVCQAFEPPGFESFTAVSQSASPCRSVFGES